MSVDLAELTDRVDKIEKMTHKLIKINDSGCIEEVVSKLEQLLNNRARDTKLNILILLISILITVTVFFGVYGIKTLYELAVW